MTPDRLLTIGAVARIAEVTTATVRNWIRSGKLTAERTIGGQHRVRSSALAAARTKAKEEKKAKG